MRLQDGGALSSQDELPSTGTIWLQSSVWLNSLGLFSLPIYKYVLYTWHEVKNGRNHQSTN